MSDVDEPLLVAVDRVVVAHELLVEDVQDRLAGDVGDVGGALLRGAAEGAQVELALLVAVKRDADVLEVHRLAGRLRAHDLDRVLVAEEVRALDGVVGVLGPVVVDRDRGVDPAGGGDRVRAHRVDLAHDRDAGAGSAAARAARCPARPAPMMVLEFDSYAFHATKAALERDRRKTAALQRGRFVVLRTTWRELTKESHALIARIAEALACSAPRRAAAGGRLAPVARSGHAARAGP